MSKPIDDFPIIGLQLQSAPNGGWTVEQRPSAPGFMAETLGAFSTTEDMLAFLRETLIGAPAVCKCGNPECDFPERMEKNLAELDASISAPGSVSRDYGAMLHDAFESLA